jgi:hypothetical protein
MERVTPMEKFELFLLNRFINYNDYRAEKPLSDNCKLNNRVIRPN